jgi:2-polyprenyl-3-methyl-5-hydroxy-6-metoxy-1,4-benzoquinol methylase
MEKMSQKTNIIELSKSEGVRMDDEWFDIAPLEHFWIQWRFQAFIHNKALSNLSDKRLFEIGCGHGMVMKQFETLHNIVVDGCDLNPNALKLIEKGKGDIYLLNIYDEPPQLLQKYDGILLMDVLEHIENDNEFLQTSCKYLQNEGLVIINVPALNLLFSKYDRKMGHIRRYNKKIMRKLLKDNNIEVLGMEYWGFSLLPVVLIRKFFLLFINEENIVDTGFKLPGKFTNFVFKILMRIEIFLCKKPLIGASLIAIGKYNVKNQNI